ncbi:hypothetical protein ABVT39_013875 [Epinephelus coioides]
MMASQAWLESSLRRSASLGREVLERASRRSVDWTSTGPSQTSTTTDEDTQIPVKRTHSELDDVFGTIAELMAQMTQQCKSFYESGRCSEPSHAERNHVTRFHSRPAVRTTTAAQSHRKHVKAPHSKQRGSSMPLSPPGWTTVTCSSLGSQARAYKGSNMSKTALLGS